MTKIKMLLLASLCLFSALSLSGQSDTPDRLRRIEALVDSFMQVRNVPAMSLGLIKDGKVVYLNKGTFSRESTRPVDENSVFQIASLGKPMVGVVINSLLAEGTMEADATILTYLPKDLHPKAFKKLKVITVRDLLHHQSGLPSYSRLMRKHRKGDDAMLYDYSEADMYRDLKLTKVKGKPGDKYRYSNFGYSLLAYAAECASGRTYEELVQKYLCVPCTMSRTSQYLKAENDLVTAYRKKEREKTIPPFVMGKLTPPSAMYSSVKDLANFALCQLQAYAEGESNPLILSKDARDKANGTGVSYGYGFQVYGDTGIMGHGGEMDGYAGAYTIIPKEKSAHVILTSCGGDEVGYLSYLVSQIWNE